MKTVAPAVAVVEQRPVVKATQRHGFKLNEYIVYPAHGVGQILAIEEQEVAGYKLELFVINFIKDKMTLRVPVTKIATVGMRKLAEGGMVKVRWRPSRAVLASSAPCRRRAQEWGGIAPAPEPASRTEPSAVRGRTDECFQQSSDGTTTELHGPFLPLICRLTVTIASPGGRALICECPASSDRCVSMSKLQDSRCVP